MRFLTFFSALLLLAFNTQAAIECKYSKHQSALEKVIENRDRDLVTLEKRTYDLNNARYVTGMRVEQILMMAELTLNEPHRDLLAAISSFDSNKVYRFDFTSNIPLPASFYSFIYGYRGDTEIGAIFEGGTLNLVAEMSDGDMKICTETEFKKR